ncbi:Two-component response regulator, YesN/AraC family, consists of REC and AraC-type DNA-binding domains [Paenibacillus sp. 1_12]|uniref:response regulator n=1 Tax=Paenibacillus sp. 1_12 TaxID=1566278 RepID=UPI0008EA2949|nr:response regulator [Paenibacillus sp. 1_12]SFK99648.1 Two-component response regulator, YesN/AraC family, consists of REC and AraC-type DNA-binding domains [Paenibacillus sp. 1_12]
MKALLVDDERFSINALKKTIPWADLGIDSLITAEDGLDGWQQYQSHHPDLVLTDVSMPNLNGLELVKKIREVNSQIPIIILSGYDEFDYAKEAVQLKVSHYFLKPIVHSEIIPVIRQVLEEFVLAKNHNQYFQATQKQLQDALPVLREQFIFDIVSGKVKQGDELRQKLDFFNINADITHGGIIMTLELHRLNNEKTFSEHDWYLYKYAVSNIAQEVIAQYGNGGYVVRYVDDRLPLLIFGKEAAEVRTRASTIASTIIKNIAFYLEIPSNIGLGAYSVDFNHYVQSHKQSKHALLTSTMVGFEQISHFEDVEMHPLGFESFSVEEIEGIVQAILKGNKHDVLNAWKPLENRLAHSLDQSISYLQMICSGFLIGIILKIVEETERAAELQSFIHLQDIYNVQTKELLIVSIKERLLCLYDYLDSNQSEHKYIEMIKQYVEMNYHNDLTVHDISKHLHLSRTYISKLFKRETGDSITGYIIKFRIRLAKKMMEKQPDLLIYEISSKVGYTDQNYFCRVFKSVTGLKPSEYMIKDKRKSK